MRKHTRRQTRQPVPVSFTNSLQSFDYELMKVMYNVYANVKKKPHFEGDQKNDLINFCDKQVDHKQFFLQMLQQAQTKWNQKSLKVEKWYEREPFVDME